MYLRYVIPIYRFKKFQIFAQLPIGSGQDLTFQLEWINGIYANNFTFASGSQNNSSYNWSCSVDKFQGRKWLSKSGGGQAVLQVAMRRGAAAGSTFYSAKKWGEIAPPAPPSLTPLNLSNIWINKIM